MTDLTFIFDGKSLHLRAHTISGKAFLKDMFENAGDEVRMPEALSHLDGVLLNAAEDRGLAVNTEGPAQHLPPEQPND
jgi:hypothetical protein